MVDTLWEVHARGRGAAMSVLRRYELHRQGDQPFGKLSGGQQARFQILDVKVRIRDLASGVVVTAAPLGQRRRPLPGPGD
ncbi:hypothetical protein TUM20985_57900 [Mycobacterium antarcticum]|uniref:hypothetical protein n=1 Tax=unclassified Mycolicibacterium TaxID=2636767 RepID=UPI0023A07675|nr:MULTISPECIES: hypothetical protein [unclassified Mycolicibacterium]BDX35243.1 hypothetical protein TUM20985_57900 [Mycolicibacterium sp. TUM20985]GLP78445.1 hypothetical protein TUM20983_55550 [Mycolicibacterium sp. TUM20983]GLP81504.1 hypothetical protein TUM20984_29240 [Mycolicibacterium sp. TUM20984]